MSSKTEKADLNRLYAAWRRMGVNFTGASSSGPIDLETLILDTSTALRTDARLAVCVASWLACYHSFVDGRRLSELTRSADPLTRAYLGALLSWAIESPQGAGKAPEFEAAMTHCKPIRPMRALYDSIQTSPTMKEWMKTHALPLFRRWGFWHDDDSLKTVSVHSLQWILKVPELQARALCGPSIEAALIAHTMNRVTNARALSREIGVSYATAHAAVERLVGRGLLQRQRNGVRQELTLSPFAVHALKA